MIDNIQYVWNVVAVLSKGVGYTVSVFFLTIIFSLPLGLVITYAVISKNAVIRFMARGYVFLMRGTPLMLQLFFFYFGLPFIPYIGKYLTMDRFTAGCVAFILNYAAYFCEIYRGGLLSIDPGQYEAARVLGLGKWDTIRLIVIPQMIKVALPPISNETITLVKDTALIFTIGISDLLHYTKSLVNSSANVFPYFIAAMFYLFVTLLLTKLFNNLEKKFKF